MSSPLRNIFVLVLLGVLLFTLALVVRSGIFEVKNPAEPINAAMRAALAQERPELSSGDALQIDQQYPTAIVLASGLRYIIRAPGEGNPPRPGQMVTVNYEGRFLDGAEFDSSYRRGKPIVFQLGAGKVIKGWDEALLNMRKGERRTLIVPYWLAYGEKGHPPKIPPRTTLVFEVELLDFH